MDTLLKVSGVSKTFRRKTRVSTTDIPAVRSVDLDVGHGETVAVVGESGSGKTTLGRLVLRLTTPDQGSIEFDGIDLLKVSNRRLRQLRARMQMIFQDPYSSLDPIMTVGESIAEPLKLHTPYSRTARHHEVLSLLDRVGLPADFGDRYPRSFSGGQLQRIAIARALSTDPSLIVCDEPVAALDISIRGQVLSLLVELQDERELAYVFVSHDLSVVRQFAHRVAVMYAGQIVEVGETKDIFRNPQHPYTRALLDAVPIANPKLRRERSLIRGELLQSAELLVGCSYRTRCPEAMPECAEVMPELRPSPVGHPVRCHLYPMPSGDGAAMATPVAAPATKKAGNGVAASDGSDDEKVETPSA